MNLPDLHINEALRQREFPVCADKVYLAHAGVSPVPACVTRAVQETAATAALEAQEDAALAGLSPEERRLLLGLLAKVDGG